MINQLFSVAGKTVFVTGGSAQIPAVRTRLLETFGAERLRAQDYLTSVATGLGVDAGAFTVVETG